MIDALKMTKTHLMAKQLEKIFRDIEEENYEEIKSFKLAETSHFSELAGSPDHTSLSLLGLFSSAGYDCSYKTTLLLSS